MNRTDIDQLFGSQATDENLEVIGKTWTLADMKSVLADMGNDTDDPEEVLAWCRKFAGVKNPAAVALGSIKSERKAASSRQNGKLGGRPRKTE